MFQGSSDQYRQFYFWLLKLKVDEKSYSGCLPAGRPAGDFENKTNTAPNWGWSLGPSLKIFRRHLKERSSDSEKSTCSIKEQIWKFTYINSMNMVMLMKKENDKTKAKPICRSVKRVFELVTTAIRIWQKDENNIWKR